jgi:hypothetical protein
VLVAIVSDRLDRTTVNDFLHAGNLIGRIGLPDHIRDILLLSPKTLGKGVAAAMTEHALVIDVLTFTPSVDTAERDLPMHGGSNP